MAKKDTGNMPLQRAALYIRVSTDEQARHGYSLAAQRDALTTYAHTHNMCIVDYYADMGASARKRYTTRKELMRLLDDVQADKIDIILFIKLDRWLRSVKDYYEIQKILDAHHVAWACTMDEYDAATTSGRLNLNIHLSIAEEEADRTRDRIDFVFASKVARGEVITGSVPLGLKIQDKHLVADATTVNIVRDIYTYFDLHNSKKATIRYIYDKYGLSIAPNNMRRILRNPLYKGEYRGNPNYCDPIIDPDLFDRVQAVTESSNIRQTPAHRIYIFASLLVCAECGSKMVGCVGGGARQYYRCNASYLVGNCAHRKLISERALENYLLDNISYEIDAYITNLTARETQKNKPRNDKAKIKRKMARLKDLYINELITMDEYKADYDSLSQQLNAIQESPPQSTNLQALRNFLNSDFAALYITLEPEKRRALWRGIIKSITIDAQNRITITFL